MKIELNKVLEIARLKKVLASAVTILMIVAIFGILFVSLGFAELGPRFFIELVIIAFIMIWIKIF